MNYYGTTLLEFFRFHPFLWIKVYKRTDRRVMNELVI